MNSCDINKVLKEFLTYNPELLSGESRKLFDAIMKIANERDFYHKQFIKERNKTRYLYRRSRRY